MKIKLFKDSQNNVFAYSEDQLTDQFTKSKTPITQEEADSLIAKKSADEFDSLTYSQKRVKEYPPLGDFADAWVKNDEAALEEYRQKCLAVKAKYPKTEGI